MLNPHFMISEKCREHASKVTILSILVMGFRVYTIPVSMIPFVTVLSGLAPIVDGKQVLGVSTIVAISAFYYFLLYLGQYLTERGLFEGNHIVIAYDELKSAISSQHVNQTIREQQSSAFKSQQFRKSYNFSRSGGIIRGFTDFVLPIFLTVMVLRLEAGNILSLVRVVLYSAFTAT